MLDEVGGPMTGFGVMGVLWVVLMFFVTRHAARSGTASRRRALEQVASLVARDVQVSTFGYTIGSVGGTWPLRCDIFLTPDGVSIVQVGSMPMLNLDISLDPYRVEAQLLLPGTAQRLFLKSVEVEGDALVLHTHQPLGRHRVKVRVRDAARWAEEIARALPEEALPVF